MSIKHCHRNGEIGGIILFTEVITERKRAEEALLKSEARFHKLAANLPGMIYQFCRRLDGSISIPYISSGCRKLMELEPETIQQNVTKLEKLIHPSDRHAFHESLVVSTDTLLPWLWEGRIITPSKELKWVRSISRPCKQLNGDILWDGMIIEISDRVQAEEQLKQYQEDLETKVQQRTQELQKANAQLHAEIIERKQAEIERQKFVSLVENSSDFVAMATLDAETLFLNEAGQKLVGIESVEQYKKTNISDYHSPEDWAYFQENIAPLIVQHGRWQGEFRFRHFQKNTYILGMYI